MTISLSDIKYFFLALMIFLLLDPYFFWEYKSIQLFVVSFPFLSVLWINIRKLDIQNTFMFVFFILVISLASFCNRSNIFGFISLLIIVIIPFVSKSMILNIYYRFKLLYVLMIGISLLIWILVLLGVPLPSKTINPLNSLKDYDYNSYFFLVVPNLGDFSIQSIYSSFKFCGPFDEHGVIGTLSLIILYIENFNLKYKKHIIVLISGIFSFSLFFYLGCFFYMLYIVLIRNSKKKIARILFITLSFYLITKDNAFFNEIFWNRLEWNFETNSIVGNNRSEESLDQYIDQIMWTDAYFFGESNKKIIESFSGSASYKNAILSFGMVTVLLYIVFFLILGLNRIGKNKDFFLFVIIFLITFYQRPSVFSIPYMFLFVTFIEIKSGNIENQVIQNN